MDGDIVDDRSSPRRIARLLVAPALLLAAAGFVGRLFSLPMLASLGAGNIPIAPITSICFVALGTALLIAIRPGAGPVTHHAAAVVGVLVAACGFMVWLAEYDSHTNPPAAIPVATSADFYADQISQVSPVTGALFVLTGLALAGCLVAHARSADRKRWLLLAAAIGALVVAAATLVMISYAIDAPLFYDSETLPMALPTAIAFALMGGALIATTLVYMPGSGRPSWRLQDVSVPTQLGVGLGGIVLAVLAFGYVVQLQKNVLWAQTRALYEQSLIVVQAAGDLKVNAWRIHATLWDLASATESRDVARLAQDLDNADAAARSAAAILADFRFGPEADIAALVADMEQWRVARDPLLRPAISGTEESLARVRLAAEGATAAMRVLGRIEVIAGLAKGRAERLYAEAGRRSRALEVAVIVIFAAVLLASALVGWLLNRQISSPVRELTSVAAQFGQGKLDARSASASANEFGVLASTLNNMADTIRANVQSTALLTEQLRRSEASLAAQNKELEAFSYSVSHDLRAPLRSIDGFSRILLEDYDARLDDEGRDSLKRIRAAAQQMAQLIDDLLRLSRLSRTQLHREDVDLSAMVREIAAELLRQNPDRRITMVVADGAVAHGDRQLLRIALTNLLDNAWKFTSTRVDARIEFGWIERDGHQQYFVRDNGVGFDPAYADNLFGAFQRLHSQSEFPGTGIGLATVQRVVQRHGGRIWAESAVDQGATFSFAVDMQVTEP